MNAFNAIAVILIFLLPPHTASAGRGPWLNGCEHAVTQRQSAGLSSWVVSIGSHALLLTALSWNSLMNGSSLEVEFTGQSGEQNMSVILVSPAAVAPASVPQESAPTSSAESAQSPRSTTGAFGVIERPEVMIEPVVESQPEPVAPSEPVNLAEISSDSASSIERSLLNLKTDVDRFIVYPPVAVQNEVQGDVVAIFRLDSSGRIVSIRLQNSSGYRLLDDEVLRALQQVSRTWRYPRPEEISEPVDVLYPVQFQLIR